MSAVYPLLCFGLVTRQRVHLSTRYKLVVTGVSYAALALCIAPWYLFVQYKISAGLDESEVSYVTNEIYKGSSLYVRYVNTFATIVETVSTSFRKLLFLNPSSEYILRLSVEAGLVCFTYLLLSGLINKRSRFLLMVIVMPFYFIWSLYFSYDIRNIALIIPLAGIITGYGISENIHIFDKYFIKPSKSEIDA